tara:strand:+ start:353 stop:616 length:264 start_codon:yes stop_codon:yes gene_type:complete
MATRAWIFGRLSYWREKKRSLFNASHFLLSRAAYRELYFIVLAWRGGLRMSWHWMAVDAESIKPMHKGQSVVHLLEIEMEKAAVYCK